MPALQPVRTTVARFVCVASTAIALSCGGDEKGITRPPATGNLTITVTTGIAAPATVHVSGPSGYTHTVTETTTLSGIPIGAYTVTADSIEAPDSIVGATVFAAQIIHGSVTVSNGETAQASVGYSFAHQRGALWVANSGEPYGVESFGVDQLRASRDLVVEGSISLLSPAGIAFDASGKMWVSNIYDDSLRRYTIADRSVRGAVSSAFTLSSTSLVTPEAVAFDPGGSLWIADYNGALIGFSSDQVAAGGHGVIAAVTISDTATDPLPRLQGLAFDESGDAWATEPLAGQVVEYTHEQLASSGVKAPAIRITTAFRNPVALAFDSHGNLWVGDQDAGTLMMFTPSQMIAGGAQTPSVSIAGPAVGGLAFDNRGTLWATDKHGTSRVYAYTASQLAASGAPEPTVLLSWTPSESRTEYPGIIAFDPWIAVHPDPAPTP